MTEAQRDSYDEVPYDAKAFAYTHPDVLATMATVFGLSPPPVETCRVLELGCANGANLLPMAYSLPGSRLLGIDLSPVQVADGQALVRELGIANVELRPQSIMEVDESWGCFDYIICHGVYSWVPPEVQEKILDIGRTNLADQGVFYVSYNAYPGWHVRGMIRQMMLFHTPRDAPPLERVRAARELLKFMIDSSPAPDNLYCNLLKQESAILAGTSDSYLLHEQLEEFNQPCLFYDFAQRAAAHGLQYLAEAQFGDLGGLLPGDSRAQLLEWGGDAVRVEQYLDFHSGRTFRRTLLVRAEREIRRDFSPAVFQKLFLSGRATPLSDAPRLHDAETEKFETIHRTTITTNHPLTKTALVVLSDERPRALSFEELWSAVRDRLERSPSLPEVVRQPQAREELVMALVRCFLSESLAMHVYRPSVLRDVSDRPAVTALSRRMAARGQSVSSMWHYSVKLDGFERALIQLLDGAHDRESLLVELRRQDADKLLADRSDDPAAESPADPLPDALESCLHWVAKAGLLVG